VAGTLRTVLFDLDGTLLEAAPVALEATRRALHDMGLPPASDERILGLIGRPARDFARQLAPHRSEELARRVEEHELRLLAAGSARLCPGAAETLGWLHGRGILLGVVSNGTRTYCQEAVRATGLERFIHAIFCHSDRPSADKGELAAMALRELGRPAALAGDRRDDVQAGRILGLFTVGCLWGLGDEEETREADERAGDFAHLRRILEGRLGVWTAPG
jgi:phosphoglycolate phosphatase-like HAD superfamily hydrolase